MIDFALMAERCCRAAVGWQSRLVHRTIQIVEIVWLAILRCRAHGGRPLRFNPTSAIDGAAFATTPGIKLERFDMTSRRVNVLVSILVLAGVVGTSSISRADVTGTCSCNSATCHGRWELRATNMTALRAECHAKVGEHGFLSKVHRISHSQHHSTAADAHRE
jgi:hypothetical protein